MNPRYLSYLWLFVAVALAGCSDRETPFAPPKPASIVLENPGFEMPGADHDIPGWNLSQHAGDPAYDMTVDTSIAATGKQSFRMTQTLPEAYGMIEQHVTASPDLIGKTMRLTAKLKTSGVSAEGWSLFLFVADASEYIWTTDSAQPIVGNTDWQTIEVIGKVSPNTARFTVGARLADSGSGGTAWLDDVELRVMEDAPTAKP